jgi:SpoIID/LytB domain protein
MTRTRALVRTTLTGVALGVLAVPLVGLLPGLTLLPLTHPASADESAPEAVRIGSGLRFSAPEETLLEVSGIPTARRFLDTLELLPRRGGIEVVNELGFDAYLYGLAEVPQSWPEAVLDAQVIAARTYAWRSVQRGAFRDSDICATVACQVFRGAEILLGPNGDRWRGAVDRTSGQVLLFEGEPILARYFSTSGGRTYANEEVFASSGPRPYLRAIVDPYDSLSPLHRWEVRFTREEFDAILAQGRTLSAVVPVARVERLGPVDDPAAEVRLTGADGRSVTLRAIVLRDFLSSRAVELFPDRFPPLRRDGARPLPSTIPTTRYDVELREAEVVIHGLGWGHGVGMGQWGAHARALEGHSAEEILAAYYGGLAPVVAPGLPARIRAGMGSARPDEDGVVEVRLTTPTRVSTTGGTVFGPSLGTWRIAASGGALQVIRPAGEDSPLRVSATSTVPGVSWGPGATIGTLHPGDVDSTDLRVEVSRPGTLRLEVTREGGGLVLERELGLVEQGRHEVRWFHDGDGVVRVPAGSYRARLVVTDSTGASAGESSGAIVLR